MRYLVRQTLSMILAYAICSWLAVDFALCMAAWYSARATLFFPTSYSFKIGRKT